jgi:integrase
LRATYITRLVEAGVPVELVAKLSGHSQMATLYSIYLRLNENAIERARAALDGLLAQ